MNVSSPNLPPNKTKVALSFSRSPLARAYVFSTRTVAFFKLFWKNFFGSYQQIFYSFLLPTFLAFIIYLIFRRGVTMVDRGTLVFGFALLPVASLSITMLAQALVSWKKSVLVKRISASPVSKFNFIFSILVFYFCVMIVAELWMLFWLWCIVSMFDGVTLANNIYQGISPGWMVISFIVCPLSTLPLGIIIAGRVSSVPAAQAVALSIFFPITFLSGVMITPYILDQSAGFRYFTYVIPFKYCVWLNFVAWYGGQIPGMAQGYAAVEFSHNWEPLVIAIAWGIVLTTIAVFTFRLDTKN